MTEAADIKEVHNFRFYSRSENMAKIIGNRKLIFGLWGLIGYIGQFILIVSVINVYSDYDRFRPCKRDDDTFLFETEKILSPNNELSAAVYDMPLRLLGAYHIIEWFRMTIFLVTMLLGSNLMPLWYITSLNTVFGIAAYIACHIYRYAGNGVICAEEQEFRAAMLMAEVIVFWTSFHIMSCPQIIFFFMSNENLDSALVETEEEEGEEGEGEKE
jgi:hypothetical protein